MDAAATVSTMLPLTFGRENQCTKHMMSSAPVVKLNPASFCRIRRRAIEPACFQVSKRPSLSTKDERVHLSVRGGMHEYMCGVSVARLLHLQTRKTVTAPRESTKQELCAPLTSRRRRCLSKDLCEKSIQLRRKAVEKNKVFHGVRSSPCENLNT